MALIHIDNLVAGMILSGDVRDRSGRLLLPAGNELTEKHFHLFRMWGILEAEIDCEEAAATQDAPLYVVHDPELLAEAREHVGKLFSHNDPEHPAVKELMQLCIHRRASRAS